jgi:hypothetical protein
MDMFVSNDLIEVNIFYKKSGRTNMTVVKDLEEIEDEKDREGFQKIVVKLSPMTWKQYNDLQRSSLVDKGMGLGEEIDWISWKEQKMITILREWDIVNSKGKPIPVTPDAIFKLHPFIAEAILNEFDRLTLVGDEERKN